MAMIEKIRRQGWLALVLVGGALLLFIIQNALDSGMGSGPDALGDIDGSEVSYEEWQRAIAKQRAVFDYSKNESGLSNDTWNQLVEERLYADDLEALGIEVSDNEYEEMMFGKYLSPYIKQTIYQGVDSMSYRDRVRKYFDSQDPAKVDLMKSFFIFKRKREKYDNLVKWGAYTNTIDAKWAFKANNNRVSVDFVAKSFAEIPDTDVNVSEDDIKSYYNKHKADREYKQERSRSVDYVMMNVVPSSEDTAMIKSNLSAAIKEFSSASAGASTRYKSGSVSEPFNSMILTAPVDSVVGPVVEGGMVKLMKIAKRVSEVDSVRARHILIKDSSPKGKVKADSIASVVKAKKNFAEMAKLFGTDGTKDEGGDLKMFGRGAMVPEFEKACFDGKVGEIQVISTQFGYHVVEVTQKKAPQMNTYVAALEQPIEASPRTQDVAIRKLKEITINSKDTASFRSNAKAMDANQRVVSAKMITPNASNVMGINGNAQALVNWAYKAEINDVSSPMVLDNSIVVAVLTEIRERGVPSFENVKDQMKIKVIKEKKGELWATKLKGASLQEIAGSNGLTVKRSENVSLRNVNIPEAGISEQEFALVGTCIGIPKDKVSEPIVGEGGVYVVQRLTDVVEAQSLDNYATEKKSVSLGAKSSLAQRIFGAYRESADIDDRRFVQE